MSDRDKLRGRYSVHVTREAETGLFTVEFHPNFTAGIRADIAAFPAQTIEMFVALAALSGGAVTVQWVRPPNDPELGIEAFAAEAERLVREHQGD
jgi:hypothetical protein